MIFRVRVLRLLVTIKRERRYLIPHILIMAVLIEIIAIVIEVNK